MRWLALALTALALAGTAVPVGRAHAQAAKPALAAPVADAGTGAEAADKLPAEHVPHLSITTKPSSVMTGDLVHLTVTADAALGDDVTLPEQSFAPFELTAKRAHVEQAKGGRQAFVFD